MLDFSLFRIKVLPLVDPSLFGDRPRSDVLRDIIQSMPSADFGRGRTWHIGNVEQPTSAASTCA
jgi:hypothetical protein